MGNNRDDGYKGWGIPFVPTFEGCSNYKLIFAELKKIGFNGPAILMPFYNEDNFAEMKENLIKEISYFKAMEEAGL